MTAAVVGFFCVLMLERTLDVCNGALGGASCGLWLAHAVMNTGCNVGFLPRELIYQGKGHKCQPVSPGEAATK